MYQNQIAIDKTKGRLPVLANRRFYWPVVQLALIAFIALTPLAAHSSQISVTCNNNSGDSAFINNAIAGSSSGDEIVIHGPALITKTIVLLGGRSYCGDSRNTVLTQANGANLTAMLASDSYVHNSTDCGDPVQISDLDLEGNKANNTAATVGLMLRSWFTSVTDVLVENMGGDGIRLTNLSANGTALQNSCVNSCYSSLMISNCDGNGFRVVDTGNSLTDSQLLDSWIASSGKDGIDLDNAAGWYIERDHVYGVARDAIYLQRMFCTSVSDNYVEDFGSGTTQGTWYGIYGTLQGGVGSAIFGNRINSFSNMPQAASTYVFLGLTGNYGACDVSVTGNQIVGSGTTRGTGCKYVLGNAASVTVTSVGNDVTNVHTKRVVGAGVSVVAGG